MEHAGPRPTRSGRLGYVGACAFLAFPVAAAATAPASAPQLVDRGVAVGRFDARRRPATESGPGRREGVQPPRGPHRGRGVGGEEGRGGDSTRTLLCPDSKYDAPSLPRCIPISSSRDVYLTIRTQLPLPPSRLSGPYLRSSSVVSRMAYSSNAHPLVQFLARESQYAPQALAETGLLPDSDHPRSVVLHRRRGRPTSGSRVRFFNRLLSISGTVTSGALDPSREPHNGDLQSGLATMRPASSAAAT